MTSECRRVPPISTENKGLRESPPRMQFYSYNQLSYIKWRRIRRATKLLSRIFKILKIPKIVQNFQHLFFFLKDFPLKIKIFKKPYNTLEGNSWCICAQNFKSISSKISEIWHKTCQKQALFTSFRDFTEIFRILFFWPSLSLQKVF